MRLETLKESLTDLVDLVSLISEHTLKLNSDVSDDCQLMGIRIALHDVQSQINGIEQDDLRYLNADDIPEDHDDEDWPLENLVQCNGSLRNVLDTVAKDAGRVVETIKASIRN
jgi:hypothetical protein